MNIQTPSGAIDLAAVKGRQQVAWGSGDYAIIGTTLQIVGEKLCEAVDLRSNQRVLDVAAGNGNATLAAARRFADVVSTDYVGALLERGRERAKADRLPVTFQEADAEALPFADQASMSCFPPSASCSRPISSRPQMSSRASAAGAARSASPIGRPRDLSAGPLKTIGKYVPPAPGMKSPSLWGTRALLRYPVRFEGVHRGGEQEFRLPLQIA